MVLIQVGLECTLYLVSCRTGAAVGSYGVDTGGITVYPIPVSCRTGAAVGSYGVDTGGITVYPIPCIL